MTLIMELVRQKKGSVTRNSRKWCHDSNFGRFLSKGHPIKMRNITSFTERRALTSDFES